METKQALDALAALARATRPLRLLIRRGPIAMTAGVVAEALKVAPATLSPHLAQLERAGHRAGRVRSVQCALGLGPSRNPSHQGEQP
jgi:DNA-binding MarR family transcriptional regulator